MNHEDARRLLDRIGVLKHACDLDLLVFFAKHPRALGLVSTRAGRLAVKEELSRRAPKESNGRAARQMRATARARPFVVRRQSANPSGAKAG